MQMNQDRLIEELRRFDPVERGELDEAAESDAASELVARILAEDPTAGDDGSLPGGRRADDAGAARRRRRRPTPAKLVPAFAAVVAIAVAVLVVGRTSGGGDGGDGSGTPSRLASALDRAAEAAAAGPAVDADQTYTHLKTRELAVSTGGAASRSWHVEQVTTREEWLTPGGPGRMRIVAGPSRFVAAGDRIAWEAAGRPGFLALGFGPRTEVHWIAGEVMRARLEALPLEPAALIGRLRHEAQVEADELPLPAATLQLIAEDLRSPLASPRLRKALYEAAQRVPGIRYFGAREVAGGGKGIAIGVTGLGPDGKAQFALVFDPANGRPLATEEIAPTGAGAGPTIRRVTTYLEAPDASFLVYRIPGRPIAS
jgi:hypothetical protein